MHPVDAGYIPNCPAWLQVQEALASDHPMHDPQRHSRGKNQTPQQRRLPESALPLPVDPHSQDHCPTCVLCSQIIALACGP